MAVLTKTEKAYLAEHISSFNSRKETADIIVSVTPESAADTVCRLLVRHSSELLPGYVYADTGSGGTITIHLNEKSGIDTVLASLGELQSYGSEQNANKILFNDILLVAAAAFFVISIIIFIWKRKK